MLKPSALATAFAGSTATLYVLLYLLKIFANPFFGLILNSQYLGADIASQTSDISFTSFLGALIAVSVVTWLFGYLSAVIYNKYSKS